MPFRFCPQCGSKLEPGFRFCPSCGERIPCPTDSSGAAEAGASTTAAPPLNLPLSPVIKPKSSLAISNRCELSDGHVGLTANTVSPRPSLRKTRNSLRLDREVKFSLSDATSAVTLSVNPDHDDKIQAVIEDCQASPAKQYKPDAVVEPSFKSSLSPVLKSPRSARGKAKVPRSAGRLIEEVIEQKGEESPAVDCVEAVSAAASSPTKSPKGKSKAKKAKHGSTIEPLQEGEELTDTTGRKWKLVQLLSQSMTELIYEVLQVPSRSIESNHILKLGAKDGRIFNEQNFLQRAAKPSSVEKWIKQNKMDFLGIPSCIGFGVQGDSYRFLIFPTMGQSLRSVMSDAKHLSEKAVLQLACRILDVLQYVHSNEYVHADINAENIYIETGQESRIYLVGYCHAFRYCPNGHHVEYREASRTPHDGTLEFISIDAHKGAAPSRRSDLQSLGYCMLRWHTGTLPWTGLSHPEQVAVQKQRYMDDVPALLTHCFGKKRVSSAFQRYLSAVMTLQYTEEPVYSDLSSMLSVALQQLGGSLEELQTF